MKSPTLDRRDVLAHVFPNPQDYLFVTGLAGPARDGAALTKDGDTMFTMAGAMGAAACTGLGAALCAPDRQVAVITGDGELLMNIGSLITIATVAPSNLTVVCIDNGSHGETGGQTGHTSNKTDLAGIARAAGIESTLSVTTQGELEGAAAFLQQTPGPRFVAIRVMEGPPSDFKRNLDLAECRIRFRAAIRKATPLSAIPA